MSETITIRVADYYGRPLYYSVMPEAIFAALETAALGAEETATVDKAMYETMMSNYQKKMA